MRRRRFVQADFKSDEWVQRAEDPFDCVVSMQAVHELRHKRHAPRLYEQIYGVTATPGLVLICDHTPLDDSPRSMALYMTDEEQGLALAAAGFADVQVALSMNKLGLYLGRKAR